jgi:hypothetical protein
LAVPSSEERRFAATLELVDDSFVLQIRVLSAEGAKMARKPRGGVPSADTDGTVVAVNSRVRVYPGTDAECGGTVVDDYGDMAGRAVEVAGNHIADAARRWAVILDSGSLVFTNSDDLVAE